MRQFFEAKILNNPRLVHNIKFSGFTCISQLFLLVNEFSGNIDMISRPEIADEDEDGANDNKGNNNVMTSNKFVQSSVN